MLYEAMRRGGGAYRQLQQAAVQERLSLEVPPRARPGLVEVVVTACCAAARALATTAFGTAAS